MACTPSRTFLFNNLSSSKACTKRRKQGLVLCCQTRASSNSIVLQVARLLGPPTKFEASKLKVVLFGEEIDKQRRIIPRIYTLTHCDFTANLTLAISHTVNIDQLNGWYNKLQRDDVVAEWKKVKEEVSLHVHCHVSGAHPLLDFAAEFRYHIFTKELPLVLEAVIHGDSGLFHEHPELMDSVVWVYFHSNSYKYNRIECWGPLKDAVKGKHGTQLKEEGLKKWASPKSVFQSLVAFLL
ncbi:magnesium dechelatase SGRL, chloroplastic-like isoform X1 [Aristolochia californica]|uniref:magnesium dechelatase SGRL, chloroplastic-like isoform X1 n=1 Tax=Aristolochia californica TaxID=171875 RepID=UPI0035DAFBD0